MKTKSPILSIGMIVKNEERSLEKCLKALDKLRNTISCELVIADTGSTDRTREIAEKYADILFDFEWCDDFAAARNAVMDRCSGKWYLSLDADEYLDENIDELVNFVTGDYHKNHIGAFVMVRNYSTYDMLADDYRDAFLLRLIYMPSGIRFGGSIHEGFDTQKVKNAKSMLLRETILHHDGYVKNKNKSGKSKGKRNLPLLENELEKDPDNLMVAIQCLESSYTSEQLRKYSLLIMDIIKNNRDKYDKLWVYTGLNSVVVYTKEKNYPEFDEWVKIAREIGSDSLQIKVDVPFSCAYRYYTLCDYENCLKEIQMYKKGYDFYFKHRCDPKYFTAFAVLCVAEQSRQQINFMEAICHIMRKDYKKAVKVIENMELSMSAKPDTAENFLKAINILWKESQEENLTEILVKKWDYVNNLPDNGGDIKNTFIAGAFKSLMLPNGENDKRKLCDLYKTLGESCDIGIIASILSEENKDEIKRLLALIEDWQDIPYIVALKALKAGVELPNKFFGSYPELLSVYAAQIAADICQDDKDNLGKYIDNVFKDTDNIAHIQWQYLLIYNIAKVLDWETAGDEKLWELYCQKAKQYLQYFASPSLCNEESIYLLPENIRFAWYITKSQESGASGDERKQISFLRGALQSNKKMKEMVSFKLDRIKESINKPEPQVSDEMQNLALQIRTILAGYAPDDPAVLQIKQSPAYKMVAHLIENS